MPDDETVGTEEASTGADSTTSASETVAEPTMAQQVSSTVAEAMQGMEARLKQSARDTARFEASRGQPEGVTSAVREALKGVTLESGESIDGVLDRADTDAQLRAYKDRDAEATRQQELIAQARVPYDNLLLGAGITPNDPRVDWAADEPDPQKAMTRWYDSIAKIKAAPVVDEKAVAAEVKARAETGVDFVDTAQAVASSSFSIPTKKEDFGPWLDKLPYAVYKEHKAEIEDAHNSGRMK